jgi:hypothetical protein
LSNPMRDVGRLEPRRGAHLDRRTGPRDHDVIVPLDDCIQWIVSLVETEDPNAFRLSVAEADAYLASFDDVRGIKARREELVAELRRELPRTTQADKILKAIDLGSSEDMA